MRLMELKQFRYFKAVAEELHFQRAARRLNLSQPALSHQIKNIEEEVGTTLLDRDRRGVALTPAGALLLERATTILEAADKALSDVRAHAGAEPQSLRVGFVDYLNLDVIVQSIARLRQTHPDIDVQQTELQTAEIWAGLVERTIDVGFGVVPVMGDNLIAKTVARGQWLVVVPNDHPFADYETLPLSHLDGEPLIFFEKALNPALHASWMTRFDEAGVSPIIVFETKQVQTGLKMARDRTGAYLVASYIVEPLPDGLTGIPVGGFDNSIEIAAAWRGENGSNSLKSYLIILREISS